MTPAASSDEGDDVPATAVKQRRKERADEHHKVMTKQRREKERAESCPDGLTTEDSSSAAIYSGEEENDEFRRSGAKGSRKVGSGDAQGDSEHRGRLNLMRGGLSTANLDEDGVLLLGAPVAEKQSVLAEEKGTSRLWLPAAAPHRHGREHALGWGETAAHALATPIPARRSTAMNRDRAYPPLPQNTLSVFLWNTTKL